MAMGRRKHVEQPLFISTASLDIRPHPYYAAVNKVLEAHQFDQFVEEQCASFYASVGRPGLPPGVYFRCLLVGYFEGLDSERGIAWKCSDSLSLKMFLGIPLEKPGPDHSTISRTRRLIDLETHTQVFQHILKMLANHGLVNGRTVGIDSTTLEANAAMRSIVRRDSGEGYQEFLEDLATQSGIQTPTREDLAKLDRKRKNKASNDDWQSPDDPDAKITRMKDGTTHLAHKAEHAVDMSEGGHGAILAVNVCDAGAGDTATLADTVVAATENLAAVKEDPRVSDLISDQYMSEAVLDKGYHSKQILLDLQEMAIRSYASEPDRGRQNWPGQLDARQAVYANRRRVRGERGRRLLRSRGELLERSFAHCYETGGMRRLYLRRRENIAKRVLIHAAGFNIGLMMRLGYGLAKPRSLKKALFSLVFACLAWLGSILAAIFVPRPRTTAGRWFSDHIRSSAPALAA